MDPLERRDAEQFKREIVTAAVGVGAIALVVGFEWAKRKLASFERRVMETRHVADCADRNSMHAHQRATEANDRAHNAMNKADDALTAARSAREFVQAQRPKVDEAAAKPEPKRRGRK